MINFVPNSIKHREVFVKEEGNFIEIKCNKIRPPRPIKIKKKLILDDKFFEIIGLYFGDGINIRNESGERRVGLANSCLKLQKIWIYFLENLGIGKDKLYAQIQIGKNIDLPSHQIFNYWVGKTQIPFQRFCKKINVKEVNTKKFGLLAANFNNGIFRPIFDNLFDFALDLCNDNKKFNQAFLRGLFAAEGYVFVNKRESLAWLDIPIKDLDRRCFVKNLFQNIGVKSTERGERLIITHHKNFKICSNFGLANLHPEKSIKFKKGFLHLIKKGNVPNLSKLKIIDYLKSGAKTRFQIAQKIKKGESLVYKMLRLLEKEGIVKKGKKSKSKNGGLLIQKWHLNTISKDY